jgi:predicted HicB family RNase H-like nuclease
MKTKLERTSLTIRLPIDVCDEMRIEADKRGVSLNFLITLACNRLLSEEILHD